MTDSTRLRIALVQELTAFCLLVVSIVLLWRDNLLLLVVVMAESLVALRLWHERQDVCMFFGIAVVGSLAEAVFVHSGVWRYANPTLLGMPVWFPLSFGTAGLIGQRLSRTIAAMWDVAGRSGAGEA
jgi:uncharacterized membrane protein YoaT (DUF817 family)